MRCAQTSEFRLIPSVTPNRKVIRLTYFLWDSLKQLGQRTYRLPESDRSICWRSAWVNRSSSSNAAMICSGLVIALTCICHENAWVRFCSANSARQPVVAKTSIRRPWTIEGQKQNETRNQAARWETTVYQQNCLSESIGATWICTCATLRKRWEMTRKSWPLG